MPTPYRSLFHAWSEIIPSILRQVKDPAYHVKRKLPEPKARLQEGLHANDAKPDAEGWIEVCSAQDLGPADVIRFDHGKKTYALYRDEHGTLFATDGICTHGNTHLANGLVKGSIIECPKHNGRFNLADGSPAPPILWRSATDAFVLISHGSVVPGRVIRKATPCASSATGAWPPSSRNSS
jgi:nitrite reductase/ring-hydroxylating ferredoxin subunit